MVNSELQVGDLVNFEGELREVTCVDLADIVMLKAGEEAGVETHEMTISGKLTPIKLTDDWFKEMGFVEKEGGWEYKINTLTIDVASGCRKDGAYAVAILCDDFTVGATQGSLFRVEYVHKLQQFIRLCWVGEHPSDGVYLRGNLYEKMV